MEALVLSLGLSLHAGLDQDYNEIHPHVRYNRNNIIAGAYYNSVDKVSLYGGYRFEPTENIGLELTVVTGYPALGPVVPMGRVTYDFGDVRTFMAPSAEDNNGDVTFGVVLGVELFLNK